jgi:hypothetical protein
MFALCEDAVWRVVVFIQDFNHRGIADKVPELLEFFIHFVLVGGKPFKLQQSLECCNSLCALQYIKLLRMHFTKKFAAHVIQSTAKKERPATRAYSPARTHHPTLNFRRRSCKLLKISFAPQVTRDTDDFLYRAFVNRRQRIGGTQCIEVDDHRDLFFLRPVV